MKVIKEAEKVSPELREEIMDYLTDLYKAGYGYDKRVEDIMDAFDLDEETANGLASDWTKPDDDEDDEDDGELNRYEMAWSQADHAWMVVYAHDMREAEGKFEDGEFELEEPDEDEDEDEEEDEEDEVELDEASNESVKHVMVKEDAGDNTKSRTESLKLTADYFLGQLRGLVDKVSKEDSEGAKLFFKNANNTLKDLVRQFEDLKANF